MSSQIPPSRAYEFGARLRRGVESIPDALRRHEEEQRARIERERQEAAARGRAVLEGGRSVLEGGQDVMSGLLNRPMANRMAMSDITSGFPAEDPAIRSIDGPEPQPEPFPVERFSPDTIRAAIGLPAPDPMSSTPTPWRSREAMEAFPAQQARERERRTIRQRADGTYTNVGNEGTVLFRGDEASEGPDVGAPGRGAVSMTQPLDDPLANPAYIQYLKNTGGLGEELADRAGAEESQAQMRLFEILQRNPFAREILQAELARQAQESAIDRTYGQERAKTAARVEALDQLNAQAQQFLEEIETEPAYMRDPAAKQKAMDRLAAWREQQEIALGLRNRLEATI